MLDLMDCKGDRNKAIYIYTESGAYGIFWATFGARYCPLNEDPSFLGHQNQICKIIEVCPKGKFKNLLTKHRP